MHAVSRLRYQVKTDKRDGPDYRHNNKIHTQVTWSIVYMAIVVKHTCMLKPQSHLADLASRLTPAETIWSALEHSECVSGLVWVIINRSVNFPTVLKCSKLLTCNLAKFMSGSARNVNQ